MPEYPEVVYYVACSVDGYIATSDGGVEWLEPYQGGDEDYGFKEMYASVDILLMGSATYEFALQFPDWPSADRPSRVFTRRQLSIAHDTVKLTAEEPTALVTSLGSEGFKRAWLMGGGKLATSFREADLISHYVISVIPVVLGAGIPLFSAHESQTPLKLAETRSYDSGIVQLSYSSSRTTRARNPSL